MESRIAQSAALVPKARKAQAARERISFTCTEHRSRKVRKCSARYSIRERRAQRKGGGTTKDSTAGMRSGEPAAVGRNLRTVAYKEERGEEGEDD